MAQVAEASVYKDGYSIYSSPLMIPPGQMIMPGGFFMEKKMVCLKPILLTKLPKNRFPEGLLVSCGSCINCRKQKAKEWGLRMQHEYEYVKNKYFITLTYNNESLPRCGSVIKKDMQRFVKRVRKNTGSEIKYYCCGEYGEKFQRPHYHAIVLVYDDKLNNEQWHKQFKDDWPYGYVYVGGVTDASINYVCGYIDKKIMSYNGVVLGNRKSPFKIQSNGFGEKYCIKNAESLKNELSIQIRDKKIGLPRYYKKKLQINPKDVQDISKSLEFKKLKKYMKRKRIKKMDVNKWKAIYELRKIQNAKNIEARSRLKKRERQF